VYGISSSDDPFLTHISIWIFNPLSNSTKRK